MSIVDTLSADVETFTTKDAWLAARGAGVAIGSSDVAAILGLSRFQSPLALYHEKLGIKAENPTTADQRDWGLILEEPIAQRYAMKTGRAVMMPGPNRWTLMRSKTHPFMVASPDRFADASLAEGPPQPAGGIGIVEIKNAHLYMADEWGPDNNNEPPVEYQVQLQHQLAVTGLQWGSIAALIGGVMFVWADIARDDALIAKLIEIETEFLGRLERHDPPPADGSESTSNLLKKLYPKDVGTTVELPIEALEWHGELEILKEKIKELKSEADGYENKLKAAIGDATVGIIPGGVAYTHKLQKRAGYTVAPTEFRVLRKKGGK